MVIWEIVAIVGLLTAALFGAKSVRDFFMSRRMARNLKQLAHENKSFKDNVDALVDYMKDPTSYDGEYSISELHPSIRSAELYPAMRDLTDEDLRLMAGYILVAPKVQGTAWGGGKIYF